MQTANSISLPACKLRQNARIRWSATHIKNITLLQVFIRRNPLIGVGRKKNRSSSANGFLDQGQNTIEGKVQIESVHAAMNVNQISGPQAKLIGQDLAKVLFRKRRQGHYAPPFPSVLGATERVDGARRQDYPGNSLQLHRLTSSIIAAPHE